MIDKKESLVMRLRSTPTRIVKDAIKEWAVAAVHRRRKLHDILTDDGFEVVDVDESSYVTEDGRYVHHAAGRAYALRPEIHAARLAQAFEDETKKLAEAETKSVAGTESLSTMVCPKCGDNLQHSAICPKCAAGKLGYRHRYTCACGGVDMASKDKL